MLPSSSRVVCSVNFNDLQSSEELEAKKEGKTSKTNISNLVPFWQTKKSPNYRSWYLTASKYAG